MTQKHAQPWRELAAAIRQEGQRHVPGLAAPRGPGAWGYIRVSREEQVESGLSLEHQAKVCQDIYHARVPEGVSFIELLADQAASAFRKQLFDRPEGRRLLTELQAGDYLIFLRMDRAVRSVRDIIRILDVFEERKINCRRRPGGGPVGRSGPGQHGAYRDGCEVREGMSQGTGMPRRRHRSSAAVWTGP